MYQKKKEKERGLDVFEELSKMDEEYRFQILLPNGTSVHLKLQNPQPIMLFGDFIRRVEEEYVRTWRQSGSLKRKHEINWKSGSILLVGADDMKIQNVVNFKNFKPHECHILRLQDGLCQSATIFENMWDLAPGTDILKELPQECTFETALADLIDDSLHDLLSNEGIHVKHLSVDVVDDMISIFAQWMDESDENPIVKWVKLGASLHRSCQKLANEGNPLYLKPYFGKFGYGGPIVSMPLGRHALVSSKTKDSKKVYTLNLDGDALLRGSNWKTGGSMKDSKEDGISRTPHGSFTKVEISEPTLRLDIFQLQCKLKDIYFPDIQYDEDSKSGETILPVKFEANGVDLAEIQSDEVEITNKHSCNGPDFLSQLQSCKQNNTSKSPELFIWGTTNFGFKRGDGITVGVDGRAALQLDKTTFYTLSDDNKKFFQLSTKYSNLVCTAMGTVKEWHKMYDHLSKEIDILEVFSGPVKASDAAQIAKQYMDQYIVKNPNTKCIFGTLIAGWEEEAGFELVNVSITGNGTKAVMDNHSICSIGYGSLYTSDMEKLAKQNPNMSAEDAAELVLKALFIASFSHGSSGGMMKVYNVGKGNYEEHYIMTALEHHYFHYGSVMDETCTLFLLYSTTDGHLFGAKLKELWPEPEGKLAAAHHVANYLDYHFHRLCFFSAQAAVDAYEHVQKFQYPAADSRLGGKFLAMNIASENSTQICVYVAKSSADLLQYLMASAD